ncbi:family 35 glycosyl hydrolase [Stachybotrys elegans]|uniref:beta-galactosidase n=1 Tax=Stachybotrys elegans TaxID=80388 RepID=A0A8K0SXZ4_9HYPO|nr:family 35 glycosyl hydrolase [Stachybotrys elegans]
MARSSGEDQSWRVSQLPLPPRRAAPLTLPSFNAFSIYSSWGFHSATQDSVDFTTGAHNFTPILSLAEELGMYVIIRPGPYVNAEENAGGFPMWLTTGAYGSLRDDDQRYTDAWSLYWEEISRLIVPHLVTNGGNVIMFQVENELDGQWTDIPNRVLNPALANYMQLLQDSAREHGVDVPLSHNSPRMDMYSWSKDFSNATGNVDVVGVDSYPSCWSCNLTECTSTGGEYTPYQVGSYYDFFAAQSPRQPSFVPEFQGGSYNPWGGPQGGCPDHIGADFANMFYRNLIYQHITAISLYMLFGGTNWGWHACPLVATSYDYSSPVSENRELWSKFYETKLLTLFTRVAKDLAHVDRLGDSTSYTDNEAITTSELRNPETNAAFYVVMHDDSTSGTQETFKLRVNTSEGEMTIPRRGRDITINGHQAKILVTDFTFGGKKLLYSTAEVLSYAVIDGSEVLALWLPEGEAGEFCVKGVSSAQLSHGSGVEAFEAQAEADTITISYIQRSGLTALDLDGSKVLLMDRETAYRFWVPTLDNDPFAPPEKTIFVQGAYLVRSAVHDADGHALYLTGDETESASLTVFAQRDIYTIYWNDVQAPITSSGGGIYVIETEGPAEFTLPELGPWKSLDSLPEIKEDYQAYPPAWVVAANTETPNPTKPASNNPVLYVDDYDIHTGNHIYRATFPTTDEPPTGILLNMTGGLAFGWSVWLNSKYIGSYHGFSYIGDEIASFSFDNATLKDGGENVLVILMDNSGHGLRELAIEPRGITEATLLGPKDEYDFTEWKIAGTAGRRENIDPIRGPLNEGGLYAERLGMHLPGFPDDDWEETVAPGETIVVPEAGVRVFRTTVPLHVPEGLDVSISFRLTSTSDGTFTPSDDAYSNRLRALLFVNGYQYGRFSPHIGHQIDFPVPPGILNYDGDNTIVLTVWSQSAEGVEMKVEWLVNYVHTSSFNMLFDSSYLRPGWTEERLQYE